MTKKELSEEALENEMGNIALWDVPDNNAEREYWKTIWLKGYDKAIDMCIQKLSSTSEVDRLLKELKQ